MEFLTDLAKEHPDLFKSDQILAGFLLVLEDARGLLGVAMDEIDPRGDFYRDYLENSGR